MGYARRIMTSNDSTLADLESAQSRVRSDSLATRVKILRAAEVLFSERGVHAVSFAEIQKAAGQKNRSAIPYHFGSRNELLQAILERHSLTIHTRWIECLDALDPIDTSTRSSIEVLVEGVVTKLDDPDGGTAYLRIASNLVHDPVYPLASMRVAAAPAARRLFERLAATVPIPRALVPIRNERLLAMLYGSLASRAIQEAESSAPRLSRDAFRHDLLDCIERLVLTEPSESTIRALRRTTDLGA